MALININITNRLIDDKRMEREKKIQQTYLVTMII